VILAHFRLRRHLRAQKLGAILRPYTAGQHKFSR
jgi:hypothetical protein